MESYRHTSLLKWHTIVWLMALITLAQCRVGFALPKYHASISSIPPQIQQQMRHYTWHPGCPVPLNQLAYVRLSYYGFDHKSHQGVLIVNQALAAEVVEIFKTLYNHHFPIQRMQPMYLFHGNDELAMEHNNSSAFNCRAVTGHKKVFSQHSYGRAVDINTLINPYVKGNLVLPKNAKPYLNRKQPQPGKIIKGDLVYRAFTKQHWAWGGNWHNLKDYQHFEKPTDS